MLDEQCQSYLKSRGYTDQLIAEEGWFSFGPGRYGQHGLDVNFSEPLAVVLCKSPSGRVTALQTVNPSQKEYRRYRTEAGNYLPVYYASKSDFEGWESTGQVFLVEGIFDRVALRRCGVSGAVFALLGLGVSFKMARFLMRHSKKIWLVLDRDEKGQEATVRIKNVLQAYGVSVEIIEYPEKDPGEMYKRRGVVKMSRFLEQEIALRSW